MTVQEGCSNRVWEQLKGSVVVPIGGRQDGGR